MRGRSDQVLLSLELLPVPSRRMSASCWPRVRHSDQPEVITWKMLWGGGVDIASVVADVNRWSSPMQTLNDLSRSLIALEPASTLIAVIEMSLASWLVAGIVPGIERQPLKKLAVDESALLKQL